MSVWKTSSPKGASILSQALFGRAIPPKARTPEVERALMQVQVHKGHHRMIIALGIMSDPKKKACLKLFKVASLGLQIDIVILLGHKTFTESSLSFLLRRHLEREFSSEWRRGPRLPRRMRASANVETCTLFSKHEKSSNGRCSGWFFYFFLNSLNIFKLNWIFVMFWFMSFFGCKNAPKPQTLNPSSNLQKFSHISLISAQSLAQLGRVRRPAIDSARWQVSSMLRMFGPSRSW